MKYLHVFILFCITAGLFGQKFNYKPSETKEVTINYGDSIAIVQVYTLPQKVKVEDNKRYYWYYLNELHYNLGGYQGNLLHGDFILLDKNNNMISKGYIKEGLKDGEWKKWYPNGNISEIRYYDEGIKKGTHIFYDVNGNQTRQENYKDGALHVNNSTPDNKKTNKNFSFFSFLKSKKNVSPSSKRNRKFSSETKNDTLLIQKSNTTELKKSENTEAEKKFQPKVSNILKKVKQKLKRKDELVEIEEKERNVIVEKEKTSKDKVLQINAGKLSTPKNDKKEK